MSAMDSDATVKAGLAAFLALSAAGATAALPAPPFNGLIVEDVTQSYVFDQIGFDAATGPYTHEDAYRGTVRSLVIKAPDNTFDFYFHFARSAGVLGDFVMRWQVPASYTVAYHVTNQELLWAPEGPSMPAPGSSFSDATFAEARWRQGETEGGALSEGWLGLDTDAKAYAVNASYQVGDSMVRLIGEYHGTSPHLTTFGPAIPEPQTYALMLAGLGLFVFGRRLRHRH